MNQEKKNKIIDTMVEIVNQVDKGLDGQTKKRGNISYYNDFEFVRKWLGSGKCIYCRNYQSQTNRK